jgi:hypothetical protein
MTDPTIEQDIQARGLNAPRVFPAQVDVLMAGVTTATLVFPGTTTTVAAAFLANGFCLGVATSACADPANFNAEIGARIAIGKVLALAREKVWELEGYVLKQRLTAEAP